MTIDEPQEPSNGDSLPDASSGGGGDGDDDEHGNPFGIFPVIVLVVLVVGGLFVIFKLRDIASVQDCVSAGRRNCAPIDVPSER